MPNIKHYLSISSPVDKVYRAVTEQEGLAGWWTLETRAKPEVGFINEFKFGEKYLNKMRITEIQPNKRVSWLCIVGDKEWVGTKFIFDLEEKDGATILRFAQNDWKDETDFFASCNFRWGFYMQSLKNYCETGKGTPFGEE